MIPDHDINPTKDKKDTAMLKKINEYLNLIKDEVMNALAEVQYIEDRCTVMTYARNGKMIVEITDQRTLDIMRREEERDKENKEPKGMAKLYTIMNG